jgi:ParB-like chromosome segregation protein Spo0J
MPKVEMDSLKRSIDKYGFVENVVYNKKTKRIVGGHQRVAAAAELGMEKIPVHVVDLSEKDEKILNIALNRISGEWDNEKLEEILRELEPEDRIGTGFSEAEIAKILGDFEGDMEELTEEKQDKPPQMIITFHNVQSLHDARPRIEAIIEEVGGRYSLSSGEF